MLSGAGGGLDKFVFPDNYQSKLINTDNSAIENTTENKENLCQNRKSPFGRWIYNSKSYRRKLGDGKASIDLDHATKNYFEWLSVGYQLNFSNKVTKDGFSVISPKRGNREYSLKKYKKIRELERSMSGMQFDFSIPGHRNNIRKTHLLFITLTYAQTITREKAWHTITTDGQELNRFKANLTKIFGSKATITVKEAQKNGYPAPHILILLDKPIKILRHHGKRGLSWRLANKGLLRRIKGCWSWGYSDVEAIVKGGGGRYRGYSSPIRYLGKYLTKSFDLTELSNGNKIESLNDIPNDRRTHFFTHLFNKIFQSRDIYISKAFKDRLNSNRFEEEKEEGTNWELDSIDFLDKSISFNHSPEFIKSLFNQSNPPPNME